MFMPRMLRQQVAGGVILRVADDRDAAAVAADGVALGHGVDGVVGPLAVHVGPQRQQKRRDGRLGKDRHVVHAAERGDELRAIRRRQDRPARALQARHRRVVVDRDDEAIGLARRRLEVADVADVQQIEAAVGKGDRAPAARSPAICCSSASRERMRAHVYSAASRRDRVTQLGGADRRGAALHHDEAAGVVRQVRGLLEASRRPPAPASSSR